MVMHPPQAVSGLFITAMAGNNHIAPVNPYPHIPSRYEKRITVMTVLATEIPVNSDPLAHRNPSCDIDITVAPFWMCTKFLLCLFKQDLNTLPGDLFGRRVAGFLFHRLVIYSLVW
jgi:hypothetical protein